jgi:tetratricopeptide (TPR) repeat protein
MPFPVIVRREVVSLPTYLPSRPDPNPMFLEKRVYQGSSGKVYPLPCTDRIASTPTARPWDAVFIENEYLLVMLLPEMGGRIHRIVDKTNNYDAVYYQPVIKPALVGLTGPWCSGGIEFNWPQHHRPSTFMPTDVAIEHGEDGSITVWMSEHDPVARMKGMHGVRLHPGKSIVELRVRAYNRTTDTQTFLWWANVATRVHEGYQSFFPPDTRYVADHAKRAVTTFPHSNGKYYGVDYARRAASGVKESERPAKYEPSHSSGVPAPDIPSYRADDLSWYANIPVPTSYMCVGSSEDFAGGYDYKAKAGLIHVANHHISPGKKQWTWGNHEFGYAWDRNLTDPDENGEYRPYIELMSGVYTDNQPDFSFLQPGETKSWSQFWYPFREIGPVTHASVDAALSFRREQETLLLGIAVTAPHPDGEIQLIQDGKVLAKWTEALAPDRPATLSHKLVPRRKRYRDDLSVHILSAGKLLLEYTHKPNAEGEVPEPATEPAEASCVGSNDELYHIGLHLEQYRHATRMPEVYWREALRRDPLDARCNLALGRWYLRRGEFAVAEKHLRQSIARSVSRNPNPYDGEPYYQLGRCLQFSFFSELSQAAHPRSNQTTESLLNEAYAAFYKATWNAGWQAAGFHALAEIDCFREDWNTALDHLQRALRLNADNLRARNLQVFVLRELNRDEEATVLLKETFRLDPLDWWALNLSGKRLGCDNQVRLDLALDYARVGGFGDALIVLAGAATPNPDRPDGSLGTEPLIHYTRAWLTHLQNLRESGSSDPEAVRKHLRNASQANSDYCFPARIEEIAILQFALRANPHDSRASFYLGNLFYDRRRHDEAVAQWEDTVKRAPRYAMAWRNLGLAYHNIRHRPKLARAAYERAVSADPQNARYVYERDQLWKRLREKPAKRLRTLRDFAKLVSARDDLSIEYCALCNQTGDYRSSLTVLSTRRFQPWEGGEGQVLSQHVRTHLAIGRQALASGNPSEAIEWIRKALAVPENLGEARHLLANSSDIHYWLGCALDAAGSADEARKHWEIAASFRGDFQGMSVRSFSEMTYFSTLALKKLGRKREAKKLLRDLLAYARGLAKTRASIDYFATSLPTMLLFDDDLQSRQETTALLLEAQALLGLGQRAAGRRRLQEVFERDPSHGLAADLLAI